MRRAVRAVPMEEYKLRILFDNNEEKIFDCKRLFGIPLYEPIKDKTYFQTVHIDSMGIICWSDCIDLNPFAVYDESYPYCSIKSEVQLKD